jgi:hypothetical protein
MTSPILPLSALCFQFIVKTVISSFCLAIRSIVIRKKTSLKRFLISIGNHSQYETGFEKLLDDSEEFGRED